MYSKKIQKNLQAILWILLAILLAANASAQMQKIYQIGLELQDSSLVLRHIAATDGYPDDIRVQPKQGYFLALKSFKNETLYSRYFDFPKIAIAPPREWFDENGRQIFVPNDTRPITSKTLLLSIPYFKEGREIEIYGLNKRVLTIDVSSFSEICNSNGICDGYENFRACPAECGSSGKDGYCNPIYNGKCDPDCANREDIDCKPPERKKAKGIWFWAAVSISIIIIVLAVSLIIKWARQRY